MRALIFLFAMLIGVAHAQTITPSTFGMQYANPTTISTPKVVASIVRMWDAQVSGVGVHWSDIETCQAASSSPSDPCYNWAAFDPILAQAKTKGQDVIYTLGQVPGWANGNQNQSVPPTNFQYAYTFVQALFNRASQDGYAIKYLGT